LGGTLYIGGVVAELMMGIERKRGKSERVNRVVGTRRRATGSIAGDHDQLLK